MKFFCSIELLLIRAIESKTGERRIPKISDILPKRPMIRDIIEAIMKVTKRSRSSFKYFDEKSPCWKINGSNRNTYGAYLIGKNFFSVQPIYLKTPPPTNRIRKTIEYISFFFIM